MSNSPWWMEHVEAVLSAPAPSTMDVGQLRYWQNRASYIHENVEQAGLAQDFERHEGLDSQWAEFLSREQALDVSSKFERSQWASEFLNKDKDFEGFREEWQEKGFTPHALGAGTPADDFLDGLFQIERLTMGERVPTEGTVNMASRAHRIHDFLAMTEPNAADVVMDLGSGNGKLALTVAASTRSRVIGVEWGAAYVQASQATAEYYTLSNARFIHSDVREVALSQGNIFYLYYPFHGAVAQKVADTLGQLATEKEITIYASGPQLHYGEYFMHQVEEGRLRLSENRGEFSEVMVLKSH